MPTARISPSLKRWNKLHILHARENFMCLTMRHFTLLAKCEMGERVNEDPDCLLGKSTKTEIQKTADEVYTVLKVSFKSIRKTIVKVLPSPTSLSTFSSPLCF